MENRDDRREGMNSCGHGASQAGRDLTLSAGGKEIHVERGRANRVLNFRYRFTREAFLAGYLCAARRLEGRNGRDPQRGRQVRYGDLHTIICAARPTRAFRNKG